MSKYYKRLRYFFFIFGLCIFAASCSSHRHSVKNSKMSKQEVEADIDIMEGAEHSLKDDEKKIIEEAMEWIGTPYQYGAKSKGISTDCSGMVMCVFEKALGLKIPRNSAKQAEFCEKIGNKHIRAGDLVFFITNGGDKINHVGIMIDDHQFIHASSKGVRISSLESNYYKTHFKRFGRVPNMKH